MAERNAPPAYFETAEREERMQLLRHLLASTRTVPYLRAPSGAGKTAFGKRLVANLGGEQRTLRVAAGLTSVANVLVGELGTAAGADGNWLGELHTAGALDGLLLLVDDADNLSGEDIRDLTALHEDKVQLLLLGRGGPDLKDDGLQVQYVDLPPFSEEQSIAFLSSLGHIESGLVSLGMARGLHRSSDGAPGLMLRALSSLPDPGALPAPRQSGMSTWILFSIGFLLVLIVSLLVFQDRINAFLDLPSAAEPPAAVAEPAGDIVRPAGDSPVAGPVESEPLVSASPPVVNGPADSQAPVPATGGEGPLAASLPVARVVLAAPDARSATGGDALDEVMQDALTAAAAVPAVVPAEPPAGIVAAGPAPLPEVVPSAVVAAAPAEQSAEAGEAAPREPPAVRPAQDLAASPAAVPAAPAEVPGPAPAATEQKPAPPAPVAESRPVSAGIAQGGEEGLDWLRAQRPAHYTLQLVGARDRKQIDGFVSRHAIQLPYAVFQRPLDGRPWYSLVQGSFPDRDAAVAQKARLAPRLKAPGIWPRTFASIMELIDKQ